MSYHYRYGGSTAARTINCPGWRVMADQIDIVDVGSIYADEGTLLHTCCEILELDHELSFHELLAKDVKYNESMLTKELLESKVIPAMEKLDELIETYGLTKVEPEKLLEVNDLIGGTIDIVASSKDIILIADYKFGDGAMVYAEENEQLMFYAWCALKCDVADLNKNAKVVVAIIQPSDNREEFLDVWETTKNYVYDFGRKFLEAVEIAENCVVGGNLFSGSHCKYCPASATCPERMREATEALKLVMPEKTELIEVPEGPLDLDRALELADKLTPWIKDVKDFAHTMLEKGADVPGWKLVQKRATRYWADDQKASVYLSRKFGRKNVITTKVITPAAAEKLAKTEKIKLRLNNHIVKHSSGTTLAPESDKREAVVFQDVSKALKLLEES